MFLILCGLTCASVVSLESDGGSASGGWLPVTCGYGSDFSSSSRTAQAILMADAQGFKNESREWKVF